MHKPLLKSYQAKMNWDLNFNLIYIRSAFNKFPDFFVQEFKIVVDA